MQTALQPAQQCENPGCSRLISDDYVLFRINGKLVCETCFDAWLIRVKKAKAQIPCPDCGRPMTHKVRSNHHRNSYECTNEDCAVIEIKEGEIHRATMLKKEAEK